MKREKGRGSHALPIDYLVPGGPGDLERNALRDNYSETRVAVPRKHDAKWLFPQEKAASRTLGKGTFTLVSL
jgi:hypothetical protein